MYIKPHHRRTIAEIKIRGPSSKRRDKKSCKNTISVDIEKKMGKKLTKILDTNIYFGHFCK